MSKGVYIALFSSFIMLLSCGNKDDKKFELLIKEAIELENKINSGEGNLQEDSIKYLGICKEIISLDIDETKKANCYYILAWNDSETGHALDTPDYSYLEKAAVNGNSLGRTDMACKYLDEGQNDKAFQILENPDSVIYDDHVTGVLFYEGATGLPKNINKACDRLALGTINSLADIGDNCLYPNFEKRRQLYAGHLNMIKYLDVNQNSRNTKGPAGHDYYALRGAIQHYESAKKLGADFPKLDEIIKTLRKFTDTYDYYLENGERIGKVIQMKNSPLTWTNDGEKVLYKPAGIYLERASSSDENGRYNGYMIMDSHDKTINTIQVKRYDDHFELIVGETIKEPVPGFDSSIKKTVFKSGIKYDSDGKIEVIQND